MRAAPGSLPRCCALALACGAARADTPIALFKSFAGNVNFVGTQKTMRTKDQRQRQRQACAVAIGRHRHQRHAGRHSRRRDHPQRAAVLGRFEQHADNTVTLRRRAVAAPAARQYFSNTIGSGFDYFGGAADVTAQVAAKRNATYTFSGLTVNNGAPYCAVEGVVGGFALLVVYSDPAEQFRVLNLYEGFQFIRYSGVTLTLSNFRTPNPLGTATGRVGHITWEGDQSLGANGEDLLFNGVELYDSLNPQQNQFNSASNINDDSASYGIDFDAYTVGSSVISAGQTSVTTTLPVGPGPGAAERRNHRHAERADRRPVDRDDPQYRAGAGPERQLHPERQSTPGRTSRPGPVVVTDTLPAGLSYVSASGTGWSCSIAGQHGHLQPHRQRRGRRRAAGADADRAGERQRHADQYGQRRRPAVRQHQRQQQRQRHRRHRQRRPRYVFTDSACVNGKAFGAAQQTCKQLAGDVRRRRRRRADVRDGAVGRRADPAERVGRHHGADARSRSAASIRPATPACRPATPAWRCRCARRTAARRPALQWSSSVNMVFKAGAPRSPPAPVSSTPTSARSSCTCATTADRIGRLGAVRGQAGLAGDHRGHPHRRRLRQSGGARPAPAPASPRPARRSPSRRPR